MKQRFTLLATALLSCMVATAQRTPEHNYDFDTKTNWDQLADFFDAWEVGTPANGISKIDDQFFISRQRPLARITDGDYQVQKNVPAGRKMLLWVPLDDPTRHGNHSHAIASRATTSQCGSTSTVMVTGQHLGCV